MYIAYICEYGWNRSLRRQCGGKQQIPNTQIQTKLNVSKGSVCRVNPNISVPRVRMYFSRPSKFSQAATPIEDTPGLCMCLSSYLTLRARHAYKSSNDRCTERRIFLGQILSAGHSDAYRYRIFGMRTEMFIHPSLTFLVDHDT
jgi:hypothetical protein